MLSKTYVPDSKVVTEIWFNSGDNTIIVTTKAGRRYTFWGQSQERYEEFCGSGSKGKFFNQLLAESRT